MKCIQYYISAPSISDELPLKKTGFNKEINFEIMLSPRSNCMRIKFPVLTQGT